MDGNPKTLSLPPILGCDWAALPNQRVNLTGPLELWKRPFVRPPPGRGPQLTRDSLGGRGHAHSSGDLARDRRLRKVSASGEARVKRYRKGTGHLFEANCLIFQGWLFTSSAAGTAEETG